MNTKLLILSMLLIILKSSVMGREMSNPAFDPNFYENVLNPISCQEELAHITSNILLWTRFLEAGLRIPRSILGGNFVDLGNYHQCLGIKEEVQLSHGSRIEGKYCHIAVPMGQSFDDFPSILEHAGAHFPRFAFDPRQLDLNEEEESGFKTINATQHIPGVSHHFDRISISLPGIQFHLAICVPKSCTVKEGMDGLLFGITALGFQFDEGSCRLNNDKLWAPVDYVTIVIFSIIGLLTLISTACDLYCTVYKKDPKSLSVIGRSFSLYTNTRRLTTYVSSPDSLECVDGIRSLAMMWVLIGHTVLTLPPAINMLDAFTWMQSFRSFWITGAPITVDTFFVLSGVLVVYTTAGKLTSMKLLKSLHLFYLNRILRTLPLLAAAILFQASIMHHIADGPLWDDVAVQVNNCRQNWWINLLYLQNFVSTPTMCLGPTWYLAVDMHLYIISPIVLYWVLSKKKSHAWIALTASFLILLSSATIYNFIMKFPGSTMSPSHTVEEINDYSRLYYINTFTRASPFFIGMIFGYILHSYRGKELKMSKFLVAVFWVCASALSFGALVSEHPMKSEDWDNQTVDSLVNSFASPTWAVTIGWLILACAKGFACPINWFLSLQLWKLPSRLSYAMYLLHYPLMITITGTYTAPITFSEMGFIFKFLSLLSLVVVISFIFTVMIDSPSSTLFKILLKGPARPRQINVNINESETKNIKANEEEKKDMIN